MAIVILFKDVVDLAAGPIQPRSRIEFVRVDNRWFVPYNYYLYQKYDYHVNVETCVTVQSIKYLYKYVYKGQDCATVVLWE
ncbi:Helitron helicase [Phytophthora megakarya]|uniref:Helitron helicase n=1 Tax=Phytophthora megakarya TaxID=4795 RepID=A0A225V273_9STRA|nr:Helitron helicase [Phytophthora megakarya]